jgi:[ribosomal protein S18]-alanine N-acetyltransferase
VSALPRPGEHRYAPMTESDLDEVAAAEKEIYPFPWTRGNFLDAMHAGYSTWVLRDGSRQVAAYSVMMMALDEAHLLNISVARHGQRTGLGWRTLDWMADVARGHGGRSMLLEVRPTNEAALRLYQRYGFERIGVRRGYYPAHGGREDAIVMRIAL